MRQRKPRQVGPALVMVGTLLALPACGPGGAGSVHVDRSQTTGLAVIPDRKEPGPPLPNSRVGRPMPGPGSPRR